MGRLVQFPLNDYIVERQYIDYYEDEDGFDFWDELDRQNKIDKLDNRNEQDFQKLNWLRRFVRRYLGFDLILVRL